MKVSLTFRVFLVLVGITLQATIAPTSNKNLLGNGDMSTPAFIKNFNYIESELIPYWTDRTSKEITLVNANFYNQQWPTNIQALKLTTETQVYQQFNAEINSTYRVSLNCSFAYNTTVISNTIPAYIGIKILIHDKTLFEMIPSSEQIQQIQFNFKGQRILNRIELIGFTIDQTNCDLNSFVLVSGISIIQIMDAVCVKGYQQIYGLSLGVLSASYSAPYYVNNCVLSNYFLDYQYPMGESRFCFHAIQGPPNFFKMSSQTMVKWKGIVIQGSGDSDQWITTFKLYSSNNGKDWSAVQNGKIYNGNWDRNTHVRIDFPQIIETYSIKMVPLTFTGHPCFRIQAVILRQIK